MRLRLKLSYASTFSLNLIGSRYCGDQSGDASAGIRKFFVHRRLSAWLNSGTIMVWCHCCTAGCQRIWIPLIRRLEALPEDQSKPPCSLADSWLLNIYRHLQAADWKVALQRSVLTEALYGNVALRRFLTSIY
jgi:hypothetical protein